MTRGRPGEVQADESTGRAELRQMRQEGSHAGAGGTGRGRRPLTGSSSLLEKASRVLHGFTRTRTSENSSSSVQTGLEARVATGRSVLRLLKCPEQR